MVNDPTLRDEYWLIALYILKDMSFSNKTWQYTIVGTLLSRWTGAASPAIDAWDTYTLVIREYMGRDIKSGCCTTRKLVLAVPSCRTRV